LLDNRQQLFGIGMFEEDDAQLGAVRGATIEIAGDFDQAGDGGGIAAQGDRIGAVDRHHGHRIAAQRRERLGDLARAGILQFDDAGGGRVAIDAGDNLANAGDVIRKSATTTELRLPVSEPSRLTSGRTASIAWGASMLRRRTISVTKLDGLPARRLTRPPEVAAVATG
jgi:hypothetical protein